MLYPKIQAMLQLSTFTEVIRHYGATKFYEIRSSPLNVGKRIYAL